ncbi:MAG: CorA family divalent cation transporter [Ethanoligenens sp.]
MLRFFRALDGRMAETSEENAARFISAIAPTNAEISRLSALLGVGSGVFYAALDEGGMPRVETAEGATLVVCASPVTFRQGESMRFAISPFSLIFIGQTVVAVSARENPVAGDLVQSMGVALGQNGRLTALFMQILVARFRRHLHQIKKMMTYLEKQLGHTPHNRKLQELLDMEAALVHYSTALRENAGVLESLPHDRSILLTEEDQLLLGYARVEMKRIGELAAAYAKLLNGTIGTVSSIVLNNFNTMLRVFSVVLIFLALGLIGFLVYGLYTPGFSLVSVFLMLVLSVICMSCGALVLHQGGSKRRAS